MTDKVARRDLPSRDGLSSVWIGLANHLDTTGVAWHVCPVCQGVAYGTIATASCDRCWEVESRLRNYVSNKVGRERVLAVLGEFYDEERRALLKRFKALNPGGLPDSEMSPLFQAMKAFLEKIGPTFRETLSVTAPAPVSTPATTAEEPCDCMDCAIYGDPTH